MTRPQPPILSFSLSLLLSVFCYAGAPYLSVVAPPGASQGTTAEIYLYGSDLEDVEEIIFYSPGLSSSNFEPQDSYPDYRGRARNLQPGQMFKATFKIARNARIGEHMLRVRTADGLSEIRTFQVGAYRTFEEPREYENKSYKLNNDVEHAVPIEMNTTVSGKFWTNADTDFYSVEARKGQRLSAEVEGFRLGHLERGVNDPYVAIYGPDGKKIAEADDSSLFTQDPVVSIVTREAGKHFVEVRHNMYAASQGDRYRVTIGDYSRPLGVYPAGGQPGEKIDVKILGDPTGERTESVQLPEKQGDFDYYTSHGNRPPNGNTIRVTNNVNVLEREPNNDPESATVAGFDGASGGPALNGIIEKKGDVDWFRFPVTKGRRYRVRVYARSIGSPLDARIRIQRAPGSKGGGTLNADDSRTSQMDLPPIRGVIRENLDPIAVFTATADGDVVLRVDDQMGKGGELYIYRVEFQPIENAIYTYIPSYGNRRNFQMRNSVNVAHGNRYMTTVSLIRAFGSQRYDGELELHATGLPDGVTMTAPRFTRGIDRVPVVFECSKSVKPQGKLIDLVVKPVDSDAKIKSGFREAISSAYYGNNTLYFHRFTDKLAFAVADEAPFTIELEQPRASLIHNGEMELKFKVKRKPGFEERVSVDLEWRPGGVSGSVPVVIPEGETEGAYRLSAGRGAPTGTYPIAVTAVNGTSPRSNYRETGAGKFFVASNIVNLHVAEPYLNIRISRAAVERGKTAKIACRIQTLKEFEGTAKIALRRLPRGIETVEEFKEIKPGDENVVFTLKAAPDALMGQYRGIYCRVTVNENGEDVRQATGYGILRVDAARGVKTSLR